MLWPSCWSYWLVAALITCAVAYFCLTKYIYGHCNQGFMRYPWRSEHSQRGICAAGTCIVWLNDSKWARQWEVVLNYICMYFCLLRTALVHLLQSTGKCTVQKQVQIAVGVLLYQVQMQGPSFYKALGWATLRLNCINSCESARTCQWLYILTGTGWSRNAAARHVVCKIRIPMRLFGLDLWCTSVINMRSQHVLVQSY